MFNQYMSNKKYWSLDPNIIYLNHGSFGATPTSILKKQRLFQDQLELEPVQFMLRTLPEQLWVAQTALADLVQANPQDLVLISNATDGVNSVLNSLDWSSGDEVIHIDQIYGACRKSLEHLQRKNGVELRCVELPVPVHDPMEIVQLICDAWNPNVGLLLLDHICSSSGWILPIEPIVHFYESKGTPVLVDGAHCVGQIPLSLNQLGASFYVSNAHKWLCAPKGSAFLHVREDWQDRINPPSTSHWIDWEGHELPQHSRFQMSFAWTGTRDRSPQLCIPDCIKLLSSLHPKGLEGLQNDNTQRAIKFRHRLNSHWKLPKLCPDSMVGHMGSVVLPSTIKEPVHFSIPIGQRLDPLWDHLYKKHNIEVVIFPWQNQRILRFSIQAYVSQQDLATLFETLVNYSVE